MTYSSKEFAFFFFSFNLRGGLITVDTLGDLNIFFSADYLTQNQKQIKLARSLISNIF